MPQEYIKPIDEPIEPTKQAAKRHYGLHPYFTKRPFNVVQNYVSRFSKSGDIVLDPFTGSGVTNVESLILKRKTIGVDISPLSCFITEMSCVSPVDINALLKRFTEIKNKVGKEISEIDLLPEEKVTSKEIPYWYPKKVKLPSNSDVEYVEDLFTKNQLIGLSILRNEIEKTKDEVIRKLLLLAFSSTISTTNKMFRRRGSSPYTQYRYWIPKVKEESNIEMTHVWNRFESRFSNLIEAKKETNQLIGDYYSNENCKIYCHSATNLSEIIPEKSVDYIFTDPPYGAHIAYLDLSTMWNAWLNFKVTDEDRKLEVIEGGDIKHSKDDYIYLLHKSFEEMARVAKNDSWLSLVFHHKEARLWYGIRDAAKDVGFEYNNTVIQPTKLKSWHKVSNPLKVLSTELIVNFKKTSKVIFYYESGAVSAHKVILNAAEREIIKRGGATLEEIMGAVVPDLFEHNLIDKAANTTTDNVLEMLKTEFYFDNRDKRWQIKEENSQKIGNYIPTRDRIRYYATSLLRRERRLDIDTLIVRLLPLLVNGHEPSNREILSVIEEIAFSKDGTTWELKDPKSVAFQQGLFLEAAKGTITQDPADESINTEHTKVIYEIASLGKKLGFLIKIGGREQNDPLLTEFTQIKNLPYEYKNDTQRKRIEQIDCIWLYKDGLPAYAFEIEISTSILSALERFWSLLEISTEIGNTKRLVIVCPLSRKKKLNQELTSSSFIGHPQFMENKVRYIFKEDLQKHYLRLINFPGPQISDVDNITSSPEI
ncbi:hypothetical protein C4578_03385 [Candidatus Microgenomates bacterium]|jgi:DNA modification methylase|nr:MAG: hypothetical protein C4578_03385 [Candidatus Microgenomates bacterium]